jgi:hypothetical protein
MTQSNEKPQSAGRSQDSAASGRNDCPAAAVSWPATFEFDFRREPGAPLLLCDEIRLMTDQSLLRRVIDSLRMLAVQKNLPPGSLLAFGVSAIPEDDGSSTMPLAGSKDRPRADDMLYDDNVVTLFRNLRRFTRGIK